MRSTVGVSNGSILNNLNDNLKCDYLNSIELLCEYFNSKQNNLNNNEIMRIINLLCINLPINKMETDAKYIDAFCRFISLLCITHNIEWDSETMNLFISLFVSLLCNKILLSSIISYLPNILRTLGHVLFERGYLINNKNKDIIISLLIPLSLPKYKNKILFKNRILSIHDNVDKLCIYYGIKKFTQSQNIETYQNVNEIYEYIEECNKNKIVINQKIREIYKYFINIRKFSIIALGHCIIKSQNIFNNYKNLIIETMFITFHFLKKEYKNYLNNKLCRNKHDLAKSLTPIIRSLSQLFNHFNNIQENIDNEDLIIQIIEDLKDLMILGTINDNNNRGINNSNSEEQKEQQKIININNDNIIKKDRHRYRNRVLLDWNGEQYKNITGGYTSDSLFIATMSNNNNKNNNCDKSFFVPFDIFSKLRMYCQHSLGLLIKKVNNTNSQLYNVFWNKLLPKDIQSAISTRPFYGSNVFTVLLYDPHPRVRNAAALTLYNLLEICTIKINKLLSSNKNHNKNNNKNNTITTISDRANETLLAMHKGLIFAIEEKETMITPRTQILKCLILLISITDYTNISDGGNILLNIIEIILKDISLSNGLYKSAVITLLSSIFNVNYSFNNKQENKLLLLINSIMPILLQEIKKCCGPNPSSSDPRIILVSLSKNYKKYLSFWWNKGLKDIINYGLNPNQHYTIILETIKIINAWITCNNQDINYNFLKLDNASKNLGFWLSELLNNFKNNNNSNNKSPDNAAIKSKICILLSSFKLWHFNLFDVSIRKLLLNFLSHCLCDINYPSVRQCSCKAVGNILTFNLYNDDNLIKYYEIILNNLLSIINIKCQKKQQYLLVSKGCCAIANICNYNSNKNKTSMKQLFIYNSTTNANDMINDINKFNNNKLDDDDYNNNNNNNNKKPLLITLINNNNKLLIEIINRLLLICNEQKHNISYNAIRAVGNISYFIPINIIEYTNLWPLICSSISHCLLNDKKLKNQWNACFAAGNALSNKSIPLLSNKIAMESTRDLYFTILSILDKCENYKVKITCCYALNCPTSKKNYGPIYYKLIKTIVNALNNIDILEANGYAKQKYKQLLKFRLILLLSHLIKLNNNKNHTKLKALIKLNDKYILNKLFY